VLAEAVAEVLRPGGPLVATLAGFEPRPGQLAMAGRVAEALDRDERLLVEAGTGTGKTLAYLIPAILSGRKVVVSTGTKTLQDQIARIDLPRLAATLPAPFRFTVMKGLGNYLCLRRFHEHAAQLHLTLEDPAAAALERVRAWIDETPTGDRADLDDVPEDAPLWREITSSPETRLGARCPFFERCFVTGMRRSALEAQLVLTNHHLFFADLALRARWPEAQVLPPYEIVIFDEAHQLEEVATEFFGLHVSSQRLHALARDLGRLGGPATLRATSLARRLQGTAEAFAEALRDRLPAPRGGAEEIRVPVPDDLWTSRAPPLARYHELDTVLDEAASLFERLAGDPAATAAPPSAAQAAVYGGLARRAAALRAELGAMIDAPAGAQNRRLVRWLVASPRQVSLRASPIDVGPLLRERWEAHPGPLVFTSATLSAAGGFEYVRDRLGLGDAAADATFPSPFCYSRQALVYIASDLPDPTDERFPAAAAARALDLCRASRGRALLLFTSFRNLRVAEQRLRADGSFPVLVQGERPRHALLAELRARIGSVLLATQSFWEGVDVPGEALSLVVVDRLPFAVPDDPLTAARIDRIREEGGDPFGAYQLPRAALALKQGFGRLIRTRQDTGVAALLDGRILRRSYGAPLLASLPPDCPRTESLDEVAAFFGRSSSPP
jgi:ATP-dependent DNA helicase DinG